LDYIFECYYDDENPDDIKTLTVDKDRLFVEKFLVDQVMNTNNTDIEKNYSKSANTHTQKQNNEQEYKKKYSQMSDHYGLSVELKYTNMNLEEEVKERLNDDKTEEQKMLLNKIEY
jgi:hypothetical protein